MECKLIFKSTLEENSPLEEAKEWKEIRLAPQEKKIFPHLYFVIHSEDGSPCAYRWEPAPRGSDFIYRYRKHDKQHS
jgi:hypothetical protein